MFSLTEELNIGSPQSLYTIDGYYVVLGTTCCPQQFEVYNYTGKHVGYLRLRHGNFTVSYPDVGGKIVYSTNSCIGDGIFNVDEELHFLQLAIAAIDKNILLEED